MIRRGKGRRLIGERCIDGPSSEHEGDNGEESGPEEGSLRENGDAVNGDGRRDRVLNRIRDRIDIIQLPLLVFRLQWAVHEGFGIRLIH